MKNIWQFLGLAQETIGRGKYFVVMICLQIFSVGMKSLFDLINTSNFADVSAVLCWFLMLSIIVSIVFALTLYIKATVRRIKDVGLGRSWWILAIIPLINIMFFLFLCLKKGKTTKIPKPIRTNNSRNLKSFLSRHPLIEKVVSGIIGFVYINLVIFLFFAIWIYGGYAICMVIGKILLWIWHSL